MRYVTTSVDAWSATPSSSMDERDRAALDAMLRAARQAMAWTKEGGPSWTEDAKTVAAVAHMVAQVGEAARRVSSGTKSKQIDVRWTQIAGMRNRIYHDYDALDLRVLAATVSRDLPELVRALDVMLGRR